MTWSFATARLPATFGAAIDFEANIEHAGDGDHTLCGSPRCSAGRTLAGGSKPPRPMSPSTTPNSTGSSRAAAP